VMKLHVFNLLEFVKQRKILYLRGQVRCAYVRLVRFVQWHNREILNPPGLQ